MSRVYLDGVKARELGAPGRVAIAGDQPQDFVFVDFAKQVSQIDARVGACHGDALLRGQILEHPLHGRTRGRWHRQRSALGHVLDRDLASVVQLDGDLCAVCVYTFGQVAESGNEGVVGDPQLMRHRSAAGIIDRSHFGREQPRAALCEFYVEALVALGDLAIGPAEVRTHRREDDPIAELHRADAAGRE